MILEDEDGLGGGAFERILLVALFFSFDLFSHLALTVAMQLGTGLVDAITFVGLLVGKIAQHNDAFA